MSKNIVIIPTYNEKENIEIMIKKVFSLSPSFDILVVDDNSPDGTAEIVKKMQAEHTGRLHLEQRKGKMGLGTAYLHGFKVALSLGADYIFEMDCDFSHNPDDLLRLLDEAKNGADLVVGSRYVVGINVINWPLSRVLMSYGASKYVRAILRMPVKDPTAGFICYKREVLEAINLDNIKLKGYGFQIEMKYTAWKLGFSVKEVSIIFTDRTRGTSKMTGGIFNEAFWGVIGLRFRKIKPANTTNKLTIN
ncbi:MAG: polyprenol monophosphomannose synthase [Bacteroidales bacterium]